MTYTIDQISMRRNQHSPSFVDQFYWVRFEKPMNSRLLLKIVRSCRPVLRPSRQRCPASSSIKPSARFVPYAYHCSTRNTKRKFLAEFAVPFPHTSAPPKITSLTAQNRKENEPHSKINDDSIRSSLPTSQEEWWTVVALRAIVYSVLKFWSLAPLPRRVVTAVPIMNRNSKGARVMVRARGR